MGPSRSLRRLTGVLLVLVNSAGLYTARAQVCRAAAQQLPHLSAAFPAGAARSAAAHHRGERPGVSLHP